MKARSICDAILTPSPGELTFPILAAHCGPGLTVSDDAALDAMAQAFQRLKLVVEPGGAAALAAALYHARETDAPSLVAVVTGGNVDADVFAQALSRL